MDYSVLFKPIKLKSVTLRNRIVAPAMHTNRDIVGPDGIEWYRNLAKGGTGLVIVERVPADWFESRLSVEALRRLSNAVHEAGAVIVQQILATTERINYTSVKDISLSEIERIKKRFAIAARRCQVAKFDGVEPHGAHGAILNQFFSPINNLRRDNYGGELANRMRMGREIVLAIKNETGNDLLVLYRHTPREDGGYTINDSVAFAKALVRDGVDIMDVSPASDKEPADLAEPIKKAVDIPVIAVGKMDESGRAVTALQKKRADLIGIGRGLIADPEWPNKISDGRYDEIVKCKKCDEKCYGNLSRGLPIECVQWPSPDKKLWWV